MNSKKDAHELQKKTRELRRRSWKEKTPNGQPLIYYATTAQLWSTGSSPRSKLWDLGMQVQGSQKATQRVVRWVLSGMHKQPYVYW